MRENKLRNFRHAPFFCGHNSADACLESTNVMDWHSVCRVTGGQFNSDSYIVMSSIKCCPRGKNREYEKRRMRFIILFSFSEFNPSPYFTGYNRDGCDDKTNCLYHFVDSSQFVGWPVSILDLMIFDDCRKKKGFWISSEAQSKI